MIASIALAWLVVGVVAAVIFGSAAGRTNRLDEDETVPQRMSAEVKYIRRTKRGRCQLAQTALTEVTDTTLPTTLSDSQKRHPAKRRAIA